MMIKHGGLVWGLVVGMVACGGRAADAAPSLAEAFALQPQQKGVECDRPDAAAIARCKLEAIKGGESGYIVTAEDGIVLRRFIDTNRDGTVDRWSFYQGGLEVYRDFDSAPFDGKPDGFRWFHGGGSRWGIDQNGDKIIDQWRVISAEETSSEIIAAFATRDARRFARVALSTREVASLGLGPERQKALLLKIVELNKGFVEVATGQKEVVATTKWVQFSGGRPGIVPAGTRGSLRDLAIYEDSMAIVETAGEHGQVQIGTLVRVGETWKTIDVPQPIAGSETQLDSVGFFSEVDLPQSAVSEDEGISKEVQALIEQLGKTEDAAKRADLIEKIAQTTKNPENRALWLRQLAETISAAVQAGTYPEGLKRLEALHKKLAASRETDLAGYVRYRHCSAEYALQTNRASAADFPKIQAEWHKNLQDFLTQYPRAEDAPEAMLQIGIAKELAGEEETANKWYGRVAADFPTSRQAVKAAGAKRRLESVGKPVRISGASITGSGTVDTASSVGKVVLVHYWATWCKKCTEDIERIKFLMEKYGKGGFVAVGVNLDDDDQYDEMRTYLTSARLKWQQIREKGGMDGRPANEMGILTVPTMILLDQKGRVVHRNITISEVETELRRIIH